MLSIRFKTTVTAVGVPRTDQKYWYKPTSGKPICNLTLVESYGGTAKKLDGALLDYIEAQFTK